MKDFATVLMHLIHMKYTQISKTYYRMSYYGLTTETQLNSVHRYLNLYSSHDTPSFCTFSKQIKVMVGNSKNKQDAQIETTGRLKYKGIVIIT